MGGIHGNHDDDAVGGEGFALGDNSFHFPVADTTWVPFHSGGVGLLVDGSVAVIGFFGSKGVV